MCLRDARDADFFGLHHLGALLIMLAAGCAWSAPGGEHADRDTTTVGGSDDLALPDCCLPGFHVPLDRMGLFLIGPTAEVDALGSPCPSTTSVSFKGYAGPVVPPLTCPTCSCSDAVCALPKQMHASSTKCPGAGAEVTTFDAPLDWSGTCSADGSLPADLACDGGPCVESFTVAAPDAPTCQPLALGDAVVAPVRWSTAVVECPLKELPQGSCGPGDVCVPPVPAGYTMCLWMHGDELVLCDDAFPRRIVAYQDVSSDDRACSPCECSAPLGANCSAIVSVFADGNCATMLGSVPVAPGQAGCVDLLSGSPLGSKAAALVLNKPGTCEALGGVAVGDIHPIGARTLCCQESVSVPR